MAAPDDAATEMLAVEPPAADATIDSADATASRAKPTDLVGRTLGKFTILEKLGRGGSGDVYRAEQQQLGRSAVIKVLRRTGALTATKIDRFLREAKLASRLDHPYAAHIYAFGAEPDGELWIAMEHVKGATLDELVNRRGPIPPAIFGTLFGRICEVVHTAHELGIIHRDLKGGNVMVIERAGQLLPKLLDFGIAKADGVVTESDGSDVDGGDVELTQVGATLGSPHYMSPEQWLRPADVDARSDIYALGVLAYRCVAGVVPFRSTDRAALVDAHLNAPPPPLPDHVPPAIAAAIERALEKDPGARWATALALGEAVQRAAGSTAPETVPIFDPYTRDVWLRAGPQPIADAVARLAEASTAVDCDAAVRELVAITCRWLAVLALATLRGGGGDADIRDRARDIIGRDDAQPWLELARAIARSRTRSGETVPGHVVPGLVAALAGSDALAALAERLDDHARGKSARAGQQVDLPLALDVAAASDALRPLEPLLAYQLVVGRGAEWAESWIGTRKRERERVLVWGDALADGEVALLDATGKVVARLSPLARVIAPLPSAEPELFLLWRGGRGAARLVAAPWGYEVDDDRAAARLATLTTEHGETAHDAHDDASPYPGLAAYRESDADRFVGREREVEALANRLIRAPLLAVLGPSGAGKSSFLHAGVVPRLEANGYRVVAMRPGRHPMHSLAALPTISSSIGRPGHDETATTTRLRELGESAVRGLVVVVDQFEELVTLCDSADERTRFAETLAGAADGARAPVRVIVTLRDDFAAVIESEPALRGRFEVFVLGTPLPEALRRIVVAPARAYGVGIEPAVVDDMVAEVAGRPASLPLLSFTAAQLWRTRDRSARTITRDAYLALGGVAGALSSYADQIYGGLTRKDQQIVRAVFGRLVAGDGTRIPAPREELEQLPDTKAVLANLIDARLLVVREDEGLDIVEIVHECLAERWDRLARWRREDATDRALLVDLRAAARRWLATGRSADLLWRGQAAVGLRRLLAATSSTARSIVALTENERAFATASDAAERRARRVRRAAVAIVMTALAAVAIVMASLGVAAKHSRDEAQQSAEEAVSSAAEARAIAKVADDRLTTSLIAQGTSLLNEGHELQALAFFAEVLRRGADSIGLREMIAVASRGWRDSVAVVPNVMAMSALPGGGFIVGDREGHVRWIGDDGAIAAKPIDLGFGEISWVQVQGDHVMVIAERGVAAIGMSCCAVIAKLPHTGFIHAAALGPSADEIATVEKDGVHVYGFDGTSRRTVVMPGNQFADGTFDTPGRHVLVWSNQTVSVVDLSTMAVRELAHDLHNDLVTNEGHDVFAYLDEARAIHIIAADGTTLATVRPAISASGVILTPKGDRVVALTQQAIAVYDRSGKELRRFGSDLTTQGIAVADDGDDVWSGSRDGKLRRYHAGILVASMQVHVADIIDVQRTAKLIATLGSDFELQLTRATAMQFHPVDPPCPRNGQWGFMSAVMSICKDGRFVTYRGMREIGELVGLTDDTPTIDFDAATEMTVVASEAVSVYGPDAKPRAVSRKLRANDVAFEDAQHVLVLERGDTGGLWRWSYASDTWARLMDAPHGLGLAVTPYGLWISFEDGHIGVYDGTRELRRIDGIGRVPFFVLTPDREHVAMQMSSGATVLAATKTGTIEHKLPAADSTDVAPSFDDTGELIVRPNNGVMEIWDRPTGEALVYGLDLLKVSSGVVFGPKGVLELQGDKTGVLDIVRDARPAHALADEIACRVPLAVIDGRLESSARRCAR